MALHKVNLNLIPVLRELLRHRSVNAASLALGRSPSAVSQGLAQLRAILDDPLLVRTGARMTLTLRAEQLIEPVEAAYIQMEEVLRPGAFEPEQAERIFVIAMTDYDAFVQGPLILDAIARKAPRMGLRFVDLNSDLQTRITSRDVDFALLPEILIGELASDRMPFRIVASSQTVAMMDRHHPLAKKDQLTEADLAGYEHIAFYPAWEGLGRRSVLSDARQPFNVRLHVSSILVIPTLLASTQRLMLGPESVATGIGAPLGLVQRPLDFEVKPIRTALTWGLIQDADPAHRWFRNVLLNAFAERGEYGRSCNQPEK